MTRDALEQLLTSARWFGGRGRGPRLRGIDELPPAGGIRSFLLDVDYDDGSSERYHVPAVEAALPELVEATDEGLVLWQAFEQGADGFELRASLGSAKRATRFRGEQSNTNVFFDNGSLLKVLRRVEEGADIEAELLAALQGSGVAPELHGTWTGGGVPLGVLVEALHQPQDGFDLAKAAASSGASFADHAGALGAALAVVHDRLGANLATGARDISSFVAASLRRFDEAAGGVAQLREHRAGVEACFAALPTTAVPVQRVHGDCHLGQVLLSSGRWRYVDFEGEPMKTAAERRELDSPRRDVAGMLRSFDYAAALGEAPAAWLADARHAFLDGYGIRDADPLTAAYEIDKAVYEVVYEARFRPELLHVPLAGLRTLLTSLG